MRTMVPNRLLPIAKKFGKITLLVLLLGAMLEVLTRRVESPGFRRDAQAIRLLQEINTAQVQYNSQYGCFASSLDQLTAISDFRKAPGYQFAMNGECGRYWVAATCTKCSSFQSDETMVIRRDGIPIR